MGKLLVLRFKFPSDFSKDRILIGLGDCAIPQDYDLFRNEHAEFRMEYADLVVVEIDLPSVRGEVFCFRNDGTQIPAPRATKAFWGDVHPTSFQMPKSVKRKLDKVLIWKQQQEKPG